MILDYAESILQLLANLAALLLCLFQYISDRRKGWVYGTVIFLCSLMSCYYWTAYLMIMGDTPNVSNLFSYVGWDIAFLALLLLVIRMRAEGAKRYFHPLMLLPIPLNLWQLTLYLPYGGAFNNIYQVSALTAVACLSLQSVAWYLKNRKSGEPCPHVALAALLYVLCEFGMWTSSCFDEPIGSLYYPFSFLESAGFVILFLALLRTYKSRQNDTIARMDAKYQTMLKVVYFVVVAVCCIGGTVLGAWIRDTLSAGMEQASQTNVYDIIPVVLFVISLFLAAFAVAIVLVVTFSEKVAENNRLREARRVAEQSNAAKGEFLANMSHEIRTPINAVLGMNEMILRESQQARELPPKEPEAIRQVFSEIGEYAGSVERAGSGLLAIINDILDFSKIEAGKLHIAASNYKLSSVLNDASNMVAFKARDKGLDFRVDVDAGLPDGLYGDEVRVRQVIVNVLNNAVKYTKSGGVLMAVSGEGLALAGGEIRLIIRVKDTGIGIRPEDVGKLFKKFERVDLQQNRTVEGTGLGLAITHSLLEMMGGGIEVESVYGEGSTFTITLPQRVVSTEPVGDFQEKFRQSARTAKAYRESFRAPDARILAVDDTRVNLTVLVNLLKKTLIRIDTATSGEEALALCRGERYDLILMDQRMPNMDGTEAMRLIRGQAGGANAKTPFICLTADAVSGARERYLAQGFADYLTKPIDSQTLEQMLIKHLPEGKVRLARDDEASAAEAEAGGPGAGAFAALAAAGIDTKVGLGYAGDSAEMYEMLLREYTQAAPGKARDMQRYYGAGDWKNYAVLAHSIKSTSRMIGASDLSAMAAGLEAAADEARIDAIRGEHGAVMARYAELAEAIRRTVNARGDEAGEDDEIMEFLPE